MNNKKLFSIILAVRNCFFKYNKKNNSKKYTTKIMAVEKYSLKKLLMQAKVFEISKIKQLKVQENT